MKKKGEKMHHSSAGTLSVFPFLHILLFSLASVSLPSLPISCLLLTFSVQKLDCDCLDVSTLERDDFPSAMPAYSLGVLVPCREELCASVHVHLCIGMG